MNPADPRHDWMQQYVDGTASAEAVAQLEAALCDDAELRALFVEYLNIDGMLTDSAVVFPVASQPKVVAFPVAQRHPLRGWLAVAAVVMLCALGAWAWERNRAVAEVSAVAGTEWKTGDALRRGPVRVTGGVVEMVFKTRARVVVEGPADLELTGRNELRLRSGRLRATVPASASGFTVHGEGFSVVDHGTDFGVIADGAAEVHVFQGTVAVRGTGERVLAKAEAVRLSSGSMKTIPAQAELFGGVARLAAAELAARPAALVYLDFDGPIANRAASGIAPTVIGCQPTEGRRPGNGALAFTKPDDRVRFTVPGETRALTLLAWVRVDAIANKQASLAMSESEIPGDVHWYLHKDGTVEFAVIGADGQWQGASAQMPEQREWLGKWMFLAATFADGQVTHYLNGSPIPAVAAFSPFKTAVTHDLNDRAIAAHTLKGVGPLRPGAMELGNWGVHPGMPLRASWSPRNDPTGYQRNLRGSFDEFALLTASLSAQEIQRLYEHGRADPATARKLSK